MKHPLICVVACLALCGLANAVAPKKAESQPAAIKPGYESTVFDFGHVGIDYTVYHRFPFVNRTSDTVRITNVVAHCDCSSAVVPDSVLGPGDSTTINLKFNTKNFYGPQNKSITVTTDHPGLQSVDYFYLSIIGQWFNGIRPEPEAAFFLPANKSKAISIPNRNYDEIRVTEVTPLDDHFAVKVTTPKAARNQSLQLEIFPTDALKAGTLHSNVTVCIDCGEAEPVIITIPVKIVRY